MTNIDIIQALDNIRINNLYVHNSELEGAKFSNCLLYTSDAADE